MSRKVLLIIEDDDEIVETNKNECFCVANGIIGKDFYNNYIKEEVSKETHAKFKALLKDEEDYIEYDRGTISNPADAKNHFSSLWFFDINLQKGYMPVYLSGVNTSSCLAMEMSCMDRECEDEEDEKISLEEILEYAPNGSEKSKETIKKLLLLKKKQLINMN